MFGWCTNKDGTELPWENKKPVHNEEVATTAGQFVAMKQLVPSFIFIFVNDHADQSTKMERHIPPLEELLTRLAESRS